MLKLWKQDACVSLHAFAPHSCHVHMFCAKWHHFKPYLCTNAVVLPQEDGGLGITFVEGNTESGVEIQSISEVKGHTGKVCVTVCS